MKWVSRCFGYSIDPCWEIIPVINSPSSPPHSTHYSLEMVGSDGGGIVGTIGRIGGCWADTWSNSSWYLSTSIHSSKEPSLSWVFLSVQSAIFKARQVLQLLLDMSTILASRDSINCSSLLSAWRPRYLECWSHKTASSRAENCIDGWPMANVCGNCIAMHVCRSRP